MINEHKTTTNNLYPQQNLSIESLFDITDIWRFIAHDNFETLYGGAGLKKHIETGIFEAVSRIKHINFVNNW